MTNKVKNILLVIGFFLSIILCYHLAIKNTITLKKNYKSLLQEEVLFQNTPKQISVLKQKQRYYDSILVANRLDGSSLQNNLLKTINLIAELNNLKVVSFLEPHISTEDNLTIKTYQLTVEGQYNAIINLIYKLEKKTSFGEVINLHFEKKKNFRTGIEYLTANFLIQHYSQL